MPDAQHATPQLIELAVATRPDWQRRAVRNALAEAAAVGWSWPRAMVSMVRLAVDPEALPGDLVRHRRKGRPAPPERQHAYAEQIRADLWGEAGNGPGQQHAARAADE